MIVPLLETIMLAHRVGVLPRRIQLRDCYLDAQGRPVFEWWRSAFVADDHSALRGDVLRQDHAKQVFAIIDALLHRVRGSVPQHIRDQLSPLASGRAGADEYLVLQDLLFAWSPAEPAHLYARSGLANAVDSGQAANECCETGHQQPSKNVRNRSTGGSTQIRTAIHTGTAPGRRGGHRRAESTKSVDPGGDLIDDNLPLPTKDAVKRPVRRSLNSTQQVTLRERMRELQFQLIARSAAVRPTIWLALAGTGAFVTMTGALA
ncbi:hypothetical protein [Gulosibacter bifidus]|uniref:Uncharacterized protein n=1 Tax=Gulosibacter bifidus TaxID=272239 RepID=A0ABW5RGL8_9MICO|nr:hypothetical protein [Gulosibacter bifidus]